MAKLLTANTHQQPILGSSPRQTPIPDYWSPSSQGDRQEDPGGNGAVQGAQPRPRKRGSRGSGEKRNGNGIAAGGVERRTASAAENTAGVAERYMLKEQLLREANEARERMIAANREAQAMQRRLAELEGELGKLEGR